MKRCGLLLALGLGTTLPAGDLDFFLSFGALSPGRTLATETVDAQGQRKGQLFQPSGDPRMAGVGVGWAFLTKGSWRVKATMGYQASVVKPDAALRYLRYEGTDAHYLEATGTLRAFSLDPGVGVTWVSSGAGEYGVSYEMRYQTLTYLMNQTVRYFPGETSISSGKEIQSTLVDPWLTFHATFVQRYEDFGVFARLSFGTNLKSGKAPGAFPEATWQNLSPDLMEILRPRQEVKIALGIRY